MAGNAALASAHGAVLVSDVLAIIYVGNHIIIEVPQQDRVNDMANVV